MFFTDFRDEIERFLIVRIKDGEADLECFLVEEDDAEFERLFFRYQEHVFGSDRKDVQVDIRVAGILSELRSDLLNGRVSEFLENGSGFFDFWIDDSSVLNNLDHICLYCNSSSF